MDPAMLSWVTPSLVVSGLALLFTVGTFWWLNARPGRLRMTEIRTFAAAVRPSRALLRIPVTLYNTGAKPLVVADLRLSLISAGLSSVSTATNFRKSIRTSGDDVEDFPHPFVVPGRSVVTKFVEFAPTPTTMATGQPAVARLEVLVSYRGWRRAGECVIRTDSISKPGSYIAYTNDPDDWASGHLERAQEALAIVRTGLERTSSV
jgi:hypothetical protein